MNQAQIFIVLIATMSSLASSQFHREGTTSTDDFDVRFFTKKSDYFVMIVCHTDNWNNFPDVKLDLASVSQIAFENCSFPATMNLQTVIRSLKIKFYSRVKIAHFFTIPSRSNFENFTAPLLKFEEGYSSDLSFDTLYDVLDVDVLEIANMNIIHIPKDFFGNWSENLLDVHMSNNMLRKIAENDFIKLVNVRNIDLCKNQIEDIHPRAFDNLINLVSLELNENRLHILPSGIFHRLIRLEKIDLSENSLDELPQDLLENTRNLTDFTIRENSGRLTSLPQGFFKNLTKLENVYLEQMGLKSLPSDLFAGCSGIILINLSGNQLTDLPLELFDDTKDLGLLNIDNNQLESFPAAVRRIANLEWFYINGNQLTTLTLEDVEGLTSLKSFWAGYNKLTEMDERFFLYLKSVTDLNLQHNQISRIISEDRDVLQLNFDPSIALKEIWLGHNQIKQFDVGLMNILKYSKLMELSFNHIRKVNLFKHPSGPMNLNRTNIGNDTISESRTIYLGVNPFHCDCDIKEFVHYLSDKDENRMYKILTVERGEEYNIGFNCATPSKFKDKDVREIPLEELNCSLQTSDQKDACTETCNCRKYPGKQHLTVDCSYRNLTSIPSVIGNMSSWSIELNMTGNRLQNAPSLKVSHLVNVTSLDLSDNNITKVSMDLFSPTLRNLRLHGNGISRFDYSIIEYLAKNDTLQSLTLHDNKWICDCEMRRFLSFVQKKFTSYDFHDMKCHGTNRKLYKMTVNELCRGQITIIVISCLTIAILGILVASLVVLYYKYQREIKIWLYSKQWCLWFVTEDELDKDKEYDAFISFSHKDEDFVEKEIVAKLESGPRPYKLCLHYRDWLAGEWIPVQISRSVAESRRTIVILTPNFLESVWGLLEFRAAHTQALKEGRTRLIVILCGDIGNIEDLDQEMKDYLRLNTYIKWGDPWFWDKLRYALPHAKDFPKRKSRNADLKNFSLQFPLSNGSDTNATDKADDILTSKQSVSTNPSTENDHLIVSSNL